MYVLVRELFDFLKPGKRGMGTMIMNKTNYFHNVSLVNFNKYFQNKYLKMSSLNVLSCLKTSY